MSTKYSNTEKPYTIDSVKSRCKNCNEEITFDEFTKTWMHNRSVTFFDNAWYCDNLYRDTGAEPTD